MYDATILHKRGKKDSEVLTDMGGVYISKFEPLSQLTLPWQRTKNNITILNREIEVPKRI